MKIVRLSELTLNDSMDFLKLPAICFNMNLTLEKFKKMKEMDPALKKGEGFYAIVDNRVVGQVVALVFDWRSKEGIQTVGGIGGVCVNPEYARRGISKKLFVEAHKFLKSKNIDLVFLGTSKSFVAYGLYEQFGYKDFDPQVLGFKFLKKSKKKRSGLKIVPYKKSMQKELYNIWEKQASKGYGPTRPENFIEISLGHGMNNKEIKVFKGDGNLVGFARVDERKDATVIEEITAVSKRYWPLIIDEVEHNAKSNLAIIDVDHLLRPTIEKKGYNINKHYGVFMAKSFSGISINRIKRLFGVNDNKFAFSSMDCF